MRQKVELIVKQQKIGKKAQNVINMLLNALELENSYSNGLQSKLDDAENDIQSLWQTIDKLLESKSRQ